MLPWLTTEPGNPSGSHRAARQARRAIDDARDAVAALAGARPGEVIFTSGGTEADNLAVFGTVGTRRRRPVADIRAVPGVRGAAGAGRRGRAPRRDRVRRTGRRPPRRRRPLRAHRARRAATSGSAGRGPGAGGIVSVQLVNNETGVVQPLAAVADLVRSRRGDVALHTDAVQAGTWLDVAAAAAGFDLVSLSAHKIGGPKGVGALIARAGIGLEPQLVGGGQERGLRSGTQNVAGIVGFGAAAAEVVATRAATLERVGRLRARLLDGLTAALPGRWRLTVPAEPGGTAVAPSRRSSRSSRSSRAS